MAKRDCSIIHGDTLHHLIELSYAVWSPPVQKLNRKPHLACSSPRNFFFQSDDISRVSRASRIVERMVNQNTFDDVAQGLLFTQFTLTKDLLFQIVFQM